MFLLKFIDEDDNLSTKEFTSLNSLKDYVKDNDIDKTWHQVEEVKKVIDWEKLYYNMVAVEAHWLYNLEGWNGILSEDKKKELQKAFKATKTVVKDDKIGRNEPCPCGSGKKFKKCCGK